MRIAFLHNEQPREHLLADAFLRGAARHGHQTMAVPLAEVPEPGGFDVVGMVGVKSREFFRAQQRAGTIVIYFDKGYSRQRSPNGNRTWEYWRCAINAHQPTARLLTRDYPADRLAGLELELMPWRAQGEHIVIAGSSQKYHDFHSLRDPTAYASRLVKWLRAHTDRPIVYRPKPSWTDAVPIAGTRFSGRHEKLGTLLKGAWALVTHGSNACFEAVLWGVPSLILGNAVARPLSSTEIAEIEAPRLASDEERQHWLRGLSYWQWTAAEYASGEAFAFLMDELHA